ncbi:hypothetical protein COLO4_32314 [Corchorus olitorius]|uniref:Protein kinase domain-containing protein n=1 Tax=Corchorus olitorius TaxID=93759 RepID=A0A1R3H020_9ROSI|nr:hypothetical protein COLO4_32314 [Corchorus olitorius]
MSSSAASRPDMVASDSRRKAKRVSFNIDVGSENAKTSKGKGHGGRLILYHSSVLKDFTRNFDSDNFIGLTQFGRLYRGKIETAGEETRLVTVKTWDERLDRFKYRLNDKRLILVDFVVEWLKTKSLFCLRRLSNDDFSWSQRIKVALQFARLVRFLHGQDEPYVVHNIDTTHIMLDEDCNPFLLDFGQISGGFIGPISIEKEYALMTPCYSDPHFLLTGGEGDAYKWNDVYSFGVILVELITKRITSEDELSEGVKATDDWAKEEYKPGFSLACQSMQNEAGYDPSDGLMITELAMQCIEKWPPKRPVIETVVERLENLSVVKTILT